MFYDFGNLEFVFKRQNLALEIKHLAIMKLTHGLLSCLCFFLSSQNEDKSWWWKNSNHEPSGGQASVVIVRILCYTEMQ